MYLILALYSQSVNQLVGYDFETLSECLLTDCLS